MEESLSDLQVSIADNHTPMVILYGPQGSGKTMMMLRLFRFLICKHQYNVLPDLCFRPADDVIYQHLCKNLMDDVFSIYVDPHHIDWMLLSKIINHRGESICQVLKLPGQHCFDDYHYPFVVPPYIQNLSKVPNRKAWIIFLDMNMPSPLRDAYSQMVVNMDEDLISEHDQIILLISKMDRWTHFFNSHGRPQMNVALKDMVIQYPQIFAHFAHTTWIKKLLFGPSRLKIACFSAGAFTFTNDWREVWTPSSDWYCEQFWKSVTKCCKI